MKPSTLRLLIALFLIAHGWVHMSLATVPAPQPGALRTPYFPSWWRAATDSHWLASRLGLPENAVRTGGWLLWLIVTAGYTLAGLALLIAPASGALWQVPTGIASVASLLLLALYWHPWLVAGVVIDLACLAALVFKWPAVLFTQS